MSAGYQRNKAQALAKTALERYGNYQEAYDKSIYLQLIIMYHRLESAVKRISEILLPPVRKIVNAGIEAGLLQECHQIPIQRLEKV